MSKKINWFSLLAELVVVFAGVYIAFLMNNYREDQALLKEKQKVLIGLQKELEEAQKILPPQIGFQKELCDSLSGLIRQGIIPGELDSYRFLQPQYPLHLIDYALNLQGDEVIDQELYVALSGLKSDAGRLAHAELLITEMSLSYRPGDENQENNLYLAQRFNSFMYDRYGVMAKIQQDLPSVLSLIENKIKE